MSRFFITSRCECQATLSATLDERRHVLAGWAARPGIKELAPAHSINAHLERFDVGWLCPFCNRNTLRMFYAGALRVLPASATQSGDAPTQAA
ncbi:hypothetical protein [Chondromyces crocatus]|uniref:Uncharacterized protein n=1 Tax=Chondromyces crocatus TaxID=52 RepID=A0A0K1EK82_CHOCO|nr:hypothetical protein [Chondromyces crocatus]AKT41008.1 uncharacterized protein CMC5_051660 [Chondromyces crocatus]